MADVANLVVRVGANITGLTSGLSTAETQVNGFAGRLGSKLTGMGNQFQDAGRKVATTFAPLTAGMGAGIKVASDFENSMAEIQARTGLTAEEMDNVSKFALKMGADTAFSGQQAADAMLQLLTSGSSVEEAFTLLPTVLTAAAASGEDLGVTADVLTDIMAAFGAEASDAEGIVDSLARAAGASSADMAGLGQGFANVGGVANAFGMSVNDTAAVLAIFSENGIKGAEAGTALKSMLMNMTRPTDDVRGAWARLGTSMYDAKGDVRNLEDVLSEMSLSLAGMPVEEQNELLQTLGGSYGVVGMRALMGSISIEEMKKRMEESAPAAEVAQARMDTFSGKVDSLKGSLETLLITGITPLMQDGLTPLVEKITGVVNGITDWMEANPEAASTLMQIVGAAAIAGPALFLLGTIATGVGGGFTVLQKASGLVERNLAKIGISKQAGGVLLGLGIIAAATDWEGVTQGLDDWGKGLVDLSNATTPSQQAAALRDIDAAVGNIVASTGPGQWADGIIQGINNITGSNFAGVSEGIASWGENIRMFGQIAGLIWEGIVRDIQTKLAELEVTFNQARLAAGLIDEAEAQKSLVKLASYYSVDKITEALNKQLGGGVINLDEAYDIQLPGGAQFTGDLLGALQTIDPSIISSEIKGQLAQAYVMALESGDLDTAGKILQLAPRLELDFSDSDVEAQLANALAMGDWTTVQAIIPLLPQIELDDPAVRQQILEGLATATQMGDEYFISFFAPLAAEVGIDQADVQQQIFTQIIQAAAGTVSASVGVQVNAAVTNASQIFQDVMAQVNAAIAGSGVGGALGAVGNAIGNAVGAIGAKIAPPGSVPTAEVGTPMIYTPGLVYAHEGERILTAEENKAYGKGGGPMVVNNFNPTVIGQSPYQVVGMLDRAAKNGARNSRRTW